ncbi:hypothetical protein [Adhaeribacter aquaticus]|uniref:hypothetical protein n=1 Tax=Adhaeribacter aquaticus TaxID=299567 RepID=UPI00047BF8CB|nr:hypothetical protein [Adhaeribacter aquaticus]
MEVEIPFTHSPNKSFPVRYAFWKGWQELYKFDQYLKHLTKDRFFLLYTNQTGIDYILLFITHKHCRGFSFLEEGTNSYHRLDIMNQEINPAGYSTLNYKILMLFNYKGRLPLSKYFFAKGYNFAYGISNYSFPQFKRKILLPSPFVNEDDLPAYKNILVFDGMGELGLVSNESILSSLTEFIKMLKSMDVNEFWVKYHPEQVRNQNTLILYKNFFNTFSSNFTIHELPQSISLESIAGNCKLTDVNFFVFLSSIGLYAAQSGRKVYSLANLVLKHEPNYKKLIVSLPDVYKELITFL